MKLIDGDIINLTEEDIDNIKKECSINFIKNDKGFNFIKDYINTFDSSKLEKYDYYGNIDKLNDEDYKNKIINDIEEDLFFESDDNLSLGSLIIYKMFKSLNMIIVDSSKANIKFDNDLSFEDEISVYGKNGIKLGHLISLLKKSEYGMEKYFDVLWSHFDFIFYKLNDYRGIIFQNPYYKIKGSNKSSLDLNGKTKANVSELDMNNIQLFTIGNESIDYYVDYLNKKQIEYINNLGLHKSKLNKEFEKYIKINEKFQNENLGILE